MNRVREFYTDRDKAIEFFNTLPGRADPVLMTLVNQEDKARGLPDPRVEGWWVIHTEADSDQHET